MQLILLSSDSESNETLTTSSSSSSGLRIYNSTDELSHRIYDYANVYLLPAICGFGMITSLINVLILSKAKLWKEKVFIYMLANSIADFLFLLIEFFLFIIRCGSLCPWGYEYFSKFYEIYFYLHLGYVLVVFTALIDISVSLERLSIINARKSKPNAKNPDFFSLGIRVNTKQRMIITCILLFALANIIVLPCFALSREVTPLGLLASYDERGLVSYRTLYTKQIKLVWHQDDILKTIFSLFTIAKGPGLFGILFVVNILVFSRLKEVSLPKYRINSRQEMKANKATLMIVTVCLTYLIGNALDSIAPMLVLFGIDLNNKYSSYLMVSNIFFFLSHGVFLFIYYFFNKQYRDIFQQTLCCKKPPVESDSKKAYNSSFGVTIGGTENFSMSPREQTY